MAKPYLHYELFEINDDLNPILKDVGPYQYLSIDNFYKRPDDIFKMLSNSWIPNWSLRVREDPDEDHNFKDYYDCRLTFPAQDRTISFFKEIDLIKTDIKNHYCTKLYTNTFSWINVPSSNFQMMPHEEDSLNFIVYMDKINSGGTALYENFKLNSDTNRDIDIRYNIEDSKCHVIPADFNKCVIFNGRIPHGGYIDDHNQYTNGNWRQTLAYFFEHA